MFPRNPSGHTAVHSLCKSTLVNTVSATRDQLLQPSVWTRKFRTQKAYTIIWRDLKAKNDLLLQARLYALVVGDMKCVGQRA